MIPVGIAQLEALRMAQAAERFAFRVRTVDDFAHALELAERILRRLDGVRARCHGGTSLRRLEFFSRAAYFAIRGRLRDWWSGAPAAMRADYGERFGAIPPETIRRPRAAERERSTARGPASTEKGLAVRGQSSGPENRTDGTGARVGSWIYTRKPRDLPGV